MRDKIIEYYIEIIDWVKSKKAENEEEIENLKSKIGYLKEHAEEYKVELDLNTMARAYESTVEYIQDSLESKKRLIKDLEAQLEYIKEHLK